MKLFAYSWGAFILIRAENVHQAVDLFLERYPKHIESLSSSGNWDDRQHGAKSREELEGKFTEVNLDGIEEIVEEFVGYDGGF